MTRPPLIAETAKNAVGRRPILEYRLEGIAITTLTTTRDEGHAHG